LVTVESKDLPPVRVGALDFHVVSSSIALNVEGLVVQFGSNCQGLLMEVPFLSVSSISSLDHKVSVVNDVKISVRCKLGNNVEWSFNVEIEIFVEFSFGWFSLPFISEDNIPLTSLYIFLLYSIKMSSFTILEAVNTHGLVSSLEVGYVSSIICPHLPPS